MDFAKAEAVTELIGGAYQIGKALFFLSFHQADLALAVREIREAHAQQAHLALAIPVGLE